MKIINVLNEAKERLKDIGIENNLYEARILLSKVLNKSLEWVMIHIDEEVNDADKQCFETLINRRILGEPFQYIIGNCYFFGYEFLVNEAVLVPRSDTEVWVEKVIELSKRIRPNSILDLCTGSGCIAVTLKKEMKDVLLCAVDISDKALEVAKKNAEINEVDIKFINSNLFENLGENKFDIIVSNPPYIPSKEIKSLARDVQNEPIIALDGGEDGLMFYRRIIQEAKCYFNSTGYLVLEFGYNQSKSVEEILVKNGYEVIEFVKDYSKNTRAIIARIGEKL